VSCFFRLQKGKKCRKKKERGKDKKTLQFCKSVLRTVHNDSTQCAEGGKWVGGIWGDFQIAWSESFRQIGLEKTK
jgi:hypothetical protein